MRKPLIARTPLFAALISATAAAALLAPLVLAPALAQTAAPAPVAPAPAAVDPAKVLATVNGEKITEGDVETALDDVAAQYPNLPADRLRTITLDFLIEMKVVAQKAKADKIDQTEDFKRRMEYMRDRVMMQQLLVDKAKDATTDAALKAFFDEQIKQIKPIDEVRARHILVEKEEEAKEIAAKLKGGEDFAKLAETASKDPGSGKEGGDLGFFTKERMVPEFAEAAFAMKPGEISAPVKSQFGWHVIKLEERRVKPLPAFEDVKERIAQALAGKAQSDYLKSLRDTAKIERVGVPPAPAPAAPAPAEPKKN
jgi:peptidyl-prolyl cis-trans isomerase C